METISADMSSFRTSLHSQEQLLLELDMYQDIAVARGSTYDTLNKRMDRCQENIETVSDDIQRLQGEQIGWHTVDKNLSLNDLLRSYHIYQKWRAYKMCPPPP